MSCNFMSPGTTHVQLKTSSVQTVLCENEDCQHAADIASRSNCACFQCPHIRAAVQTETLPAVSTLNTDILDQLVADKVVAQSSVKPTVQLRDSATAVGTPPVACWYPPGSTYAYKCSLVMFTTTANFVELLCVSAPARAYSIAQVPVRESAGLRVRGATSPRVYLYVKFRRSTRVGFRTQFGWFGGLRCTVYPGRPEWSKVQTCVSAGEQ